MDGLNPVNLQNAILPLFSAALFLGVGITVFFLNKQEHRTAFLRFCYFTFHWQFSWFVLFYVNDPRYSDLIVKIGYSGIIFLPIAFYEAIFAYLRIEIKYVRIFYSVGLAFLAFLWFTDLFIAGSYQYFFGYYPKANYLHVPYLGLVTYSLLSITLNLTKMYRNAREKVKKTQLLFYLVAVGIYSIAAVDYLLNYPYLLSKLNLILYPVGVFFIIISLLVFVLSHFITLNIQLEQKVEEKTYQLKQSYEELKRTEETKRKFISNISHDLKTPLSVISGHVDLLKNSTAIISEKDIRYTEYIISSLAQMDRLLDTLINIALLESKEDKPELALFDYTQLITHFAEQFRPEAAKQNKEFTITVPDRKIIVKIDRIWIERILGNLIDNAFKFTETHDEIKILVYNDSAFVYTEVIDTGCGIDKDKIKYVFDREYQVDGEQKGIGHGLGLSIAKEKVELLGGRIDVSSMMDKGTIFRFKIPIYADQAAEHLNALEPEERDFVERRSGHDRRVNKRAELYIQAITLDNLRIEIERYENKAPDKSTILICEDNIGQLHLLIESLRENYNLLFAENGNHGLKKLEQYGETIDLIISDVKMPEMDGIEFCQKVLEQEQYAHMPFIFLTAYFNDDDQFIGLRSGATDYLQKPFSKTILLEKVNHWINRRRYEIFLTELAQKYERKAEEISRIKSILIHEINNPVQMIVGAGCMLEMLDSKTQIKDDQRAYLEKYIQVLNQGILSLMSVIETSKWIDAENIIKHPEPVENILESGLAQTSHLINDIRVEIDNRADHQLVMVDKNMISQVFVNVIRNAAEAIQAKYLAEAGRIKITIEAGTSCTVKIADNGIGMPPDILKKIFGFRFTTKKEGSGIGLHLSKMIVRLHEGDIWAESEAGKGTTFNIKLPLAA